jgi:uncharacterized protein YcnI
VERRAPRCGGPFCFPDLRTKTFPHHCHVQHGRPEKVIAQTRTRWTGVDAHPCTSREKGNNVMNRHHRSNPATRTRGRQKRRILTGLLSGITVTAATLAAAQAPAGAHATVQLYGSEPGVGAYGHIFLRIPHGCEGRSTDTVEVTIPTGFTSVKPERKDGWKTRITRNEKGRITTISWHGGNLPDDHFEDFGLSVKYPEKPGTYHLPTVQRCGKASVAWDQIAKPGQDPKALERPAPRVIVAEDDSGHGNGKVHGTQQHKGDAVALAFNGRITVIADLSATRRGETASIILEQPNGSIRLGTVRLDAAGDLMTGYPLVRIGQNGWRITGGDEIVVTVKGIEAARTTITPRK